MPLVHELEWVDSYDAGLKRVLCHEEGGATLPHADLNEQGLRAEPIPDVIENMNVFVEALLITLLVLE